MEKCPWENCVEWWDSAEIRDHVSSEHLKYNPYRCDACDTKFPSRSQITYHQQIEHGNAPAAVSCCMNKQKEAQLADYLSEIYSSNSNSQGNESEPNSSHTRSNTGKKFSLGGRRFGYDYPAGDAREGVAGVTANVLSRHSPASVSVGTTSGDCQSPLYRGAIGITTENIGDNVADLTSADLDVNRDCDRTNDLDNKSSLMIAYTDLFKNLGNEKSGESSSNCPETSEEIPAHIVAMCLETTNKRHALITENVDKKFNHFVGQIILSMCNSKSPRDINDNTRAIKRCSLQELIDLQGPPTRDAILIGLSKFRHFLPKSEKGKIEMVSHTLGHIKKLLNQRILRDRKAPNSSGSGRY